MDLGRILDGPPEPSLLPAFSTKDESVVDGPRDYALLAPMTSFQRKLTDQVVSLHYSDLLKLYETPDPVMPESLETLYHNASLVASHPYLLADHYLPHSLLLKDVPAVLGRESGKFGVLGDVLELIRNRTLSIGLIARAGKTIDLLEAFLIGKFVNYRRYEGSYLRKPGDDDKVAPTIHLIPSGGIDPAHVAGIRVDMIVGFDNSLDLQSAHVASLRTQLRPDVAPIVRLVVRNSVEHIVLRVQKPGELPLASPVHMRRVLAAIVVLRGSVGILPAELQPLYHQNLSTLAPWFRDPSTPWLLEGLPLITEYTPADVERSLLTEVDSGEPPPKDEPSSNPDYYRVKRLKRDQEYSSDGIGGGQPHPTLLTHALIHRASELQTTNEGLVSEVEDLRTNASARQTLYEKTLEELELLVNQSRDLEGQIKSANHKAERAAADTVRYTEKLDAASKEIEELKHVISGGPKDKSLFDEQRVQIRDLTTELVKAKETIASRDRDAEYTRNEYQRASTAAAEANTEIADLKVRLAEMAKRADGEAIRLRALTFDEERAAKDEQIKQLAGRVALLEEHLRRVSESEKQNVGRSRYASRASSVPRRTMSPSQTSSPNGDHPLRS